MYRLIGGHLYNVSDSNFDAARSVNSFGAECSKLIWPADCTAWCSDYSEPWLQVRVIFFMLCICISVYCILA